MADKKYDGVVEAVHYSPDGRVEWVRAYLRRGAAWSDRVILQRDQLVREIKAGKKFMVGQRVVYMAGTFEVSSPIKLNGQEGSEVLNSTLKPADGDCLEGVPIL
jgi:hypothetical protein